MKRRELLQSGLAGGLGVFLAGQAGAAASPVVGGGGKPKGVVFLVSDGMSQGVLAMAEAFRRQQSGVGTAWWGLLERPGVVHGLMDTASANSLVTDSAAASTAWSTGVRVPNGQICVDERGRNLESIGETLVGEGVKLGLVTTSRLTHATPAGFATNSVNRDDEELIAPQFLNRAEVLLGGGAFYFDGKRREDERDLFGEYEKAGYEILRSRKDLAGAKGGKLLGTFWPHHLPFMLDWQNQEEMRNQVPTLAEMTELGLGHLLAGGERFLLQVEGARIDHAAHGNDIGALLHEQLAFDEAVKKVLGMLAGRDDVLVVLTSDHGNANPGLNGTGAKYGRTNEHFERIGGLKRSFESLLKDWERQKDGGLGDFVGLMKGGLGFEMRPEEAEVILDSLAGQEVVEWSHQLNNPGGLMGQVVGNHTGTGWTGISHTSDPTQLTALGPGAEAFAGMVRNDRVRDRLLGLLVG
ncbi:MAG: alkaline phosphatase [Verrucomicrobiota bacterium]